MAFPGRNYAPPGVYTQTFFDSPIAGGIDTLKIPVFVGEGNELLTQRNLELVRGSSSTADQRIFKEDLTGRAVVSINTFGEVTLGDFDGEITRVQTRKFPIVNGDGTGTTATRSADVSVEINGEQVIVLSLDGESGVIELVQAPQPGDEVRVTYFFNRTDTLITDDVSSQVSDDNAIIRGQVGVADEDAPEATSPPETLSFNADILNAQGQVVVPANNVLLLTVDGEDVTIGIPPRDDYTVADIANVINASLVGSLVASRFTNNFGLSALQLVADQDLAIGNGSANAALGLVAGDVATRTRTFYTFQGPIVDGTNGGVTTTNPADVTVTVDGDEVVPTSVDGSLRAITLPFAPEAGATVEITYYFNAWQDTFDYLQHLNVQDILQVGDVPNSSSFIEEADFVLRDDRIHWGTSVSVESGLHTEGFEFFDDTQITTLLIDNKTYMTPATAVTDTSTGNVVESNTQFQLALAPTLGNGRDTSLGQDLFQTVANDRIDLPVNRPDVIDAYWGFSVQDALDRGAVEIDRVEGSVITLKEAVPVGATVYATHFYNVLTDNEYTVEVVTPGVSGVGTYQIFDQGGNTVFNLTFDAGSKGSSLTGIPINWPSGSELSDDLRFESVSGNQFTGPVQEIVTVQFASREATPAKYTVPGDGDYEIVEDRSDRANVYVDGAVLNNNGAGDAGLDLSNPSGFDAGFFASLVSGEIDYTGGASATVGQTYDLTTSETLNLTIDGVITPMVVEATTNVTVDHFVTKINEAVGGHQSTLVAAAATTATLDAAVRSGIDDYYNGWVIVIGDPSGAAGEFFEITDYDGGTGVATIDGTWAVTPLAGDDYYIYDPDALTKLTGLTRFDGSVETAAGNYDKLAFSYVGTTATTGGAITADIGNGPFATAADLATEVQTQINAAVTAAAIAPMAGFQVFVDADPEGRLQFSIQLPGVDSAGYFAFVDGATVAEDFAILAGLDTDATISGSQAKLLQGPIARRYTPTSGTTLLHDRLVLRNRILPGSDGSLASIGFEDQQSLSVGNGSGNEKTGLEAGDFGMGADKAVVDPASLFGHVGFVSGQGTTFGDDRDYQPAVIFYDGSGANPANNVLEFTLDGVPVSVTFTASGSGTLTALGPASVTDSVLEQIISAMAALPGTPFGNAVNIRDTLQLVRQEGAGLRLTSALSSVSSSVIIGAGSANSVLGFTEGDTSTRGLVSPYVLASAFNSNRHSTLSTWLHDFSATTTNYFSDDALAWVQLDGTGNEYLYLQSNTLGTTSAIQWRQSTVGGVQTDDVLFPTTGLLVPNLDGAVGEEALDGFFVTSNNSNGSGSANDSVLNNGVGADGIVGQTYRDDVTGLTFTILPRGFQDNPNGPWLSYPTGSNATFRIEVSDTFETDANIPHNALGGVELTVANTLDVAEGDSAVVSTFERGGNEPAIGDIYYVSYQYTKDDFDTSLFTRLSAVEDNYGEISPDNPVSLAASLAYINGAQLIGITQVQRASDGAQATLTDYRDAVDELEGFLPGQIQPDIITLLRGDSLDLYQYLKRSCVRQSSIRFRAERTAVLGVSGGTSPRDVQDWAQALGETRVRLVYPDVATLSITNELSETTTYLVDGTQIAAAMVGSVVSPNLDVATPWTGRSLVGFNQLGRRLDAVIANETAIRGVTVLTDRPPFLRVRQGFTTDMSNILTRLPTITLIADEVQRQSRAVLENFIGVKFIPGILSQVEGRLSMLLKSLVAAQIISNYTGVEANPADDDPTVAEVEAFYSPIFPLLYIVLTFHLRSQL